MLRKTNPGGKISRVGISRAHDVAQDSRAAQGGLAGAESGVNTQSRVMGTLHGSHSN